MVERPAASDELRPDGTSAFMCVICGLSAGWAGGRVTSDQRRRAKAVNFGVIYGQSAFGLAKQLRIERGEAAKFIEAYFAQYPTIDRFLDQVLEEFQAQIDLAGLRIPTVVTIEAHNIEEFE